MAREHQKSVSSQKRHDAQLKASQQSAGAQNDARCDVNLAGIDDKVKCIIKDTGKSQSIKSSGNFVPPTQFGPANKRMRQQENAIDLKIPTDSNHKKKSNFKLRRRHKLCNSCLKMLKSSPTHLHSNKLLLLQSQR